MRLLLLRAAALLILAAPVTALAAPAAQAAPALPSSDPFYAYSGALAPVAPGTVLRSRTITVAENGSPTPITATQLLYRTTGELGQPTVTVTTVLRPATGVLVTRLVSYQTAYDALGSECDPSYTLQGGNSSYSTAQDEEQIILGYLAAGDTVVVPDYEGEALDWAAGQESGYGTLDGIRAAESFLHAPASSTPVGMVGYSGGSIATDFAAELAPSYSPELNVVGTAEGGIPADFLHNLAYINGSPSWSGVIPAVFVSLARAFAVNLQQYLSPYGVQVTNQVSGECINNFLGAYPGLTFQKLAKPQYQSITDIPVLLQIANHLIMSRTGTPKGPLYMGVGNVDGTGDGVMVAADDEALAHTYCERGVSVQFNVYSGDDHTAAAVPFEAGALSFINQRLGGTPVSNGCGSIGAGNSLAPAAVPAGTAPLVPVIRYRYVGRVKRRHAVEIKLWSAHGTVTRLLVTLRRGRRVITRVRIARLGTGKRAVFLRRRGRMPAAGRYTVTVSQGKHTLLTRRQRIR